MKTINIFRLSLSHVKKSKLRSWLTIIGIVIGVAAVVAIVSIGEGMQENVASRLKSLGADLVTVSPGYSRASGGGGFEGGRGGGSANINLTDRDTNAIKQVSGVLYVNGMVSGRSDMTIGTEKTSVSVTGVDPNIWRSMVTTELEAGRYLQPGDSNSVVIGYSLAHETFLDPISLNRPVTIGGKNFKVVGIFVQSGGGFGGGGDNAVYMSDDYARNVITTNVSRNVFTSIMVKVIDPNLANKVATAIAAVSLIVGAVGIANTMFMSVMERTRQIGLLKALGATDGEVTELFLMEAGLFGFVGGIIGIITGIMISVTISAVGLRAIGPGGTMNAVVTPQLLVFALIFSIIIGTISGVASARSAAKMNPVDALRFEQ